MTPMPSLQSSKDTVTKFNQDNRRVTTSTAEADSAGAAALKNKTDYEQLIHDLGLLVGKANIARCRIAG